MCGKDGERYTVYYPDGTMTLDRCKRHAVPLLEFKDTPGQWNATNHTKAKFKVSSLDDIAAQRKGR